MLLVEIMSVLGGILMNSFSYKMALLLFVLECLNVHFSESPHGRPVRNFNLTLSDFFFEVGKKQVYSTKPKIFKELEM